MADTKSKPQACEERIENKMTLYQLTDEYLQLLNMMDDRELDQRTISDTLEAVGGEIEDKADNYAKLIRNSEVMADGLKSEIERLTAREKAIRNNIRRVKEALQSAMVLTGKTKFKTELFSFGIQKNPHSVKITDETYIPSIYYIQQAPKLDKKFLLEDLKAGVEIEGCTLTQTESLRIR